MNRFYDIVETAEDILADAEETLSPGRFISRLLSGEQVESLDDEGIELFSPSAIFTALSLRSSNPFSEQMSRLFEVVGFPGERMLDAVQPGDLLVRHGLGEPGADHIAMITSDSLMSREELSHSGYEAESILPGGYAGVLEAGAFPRGTGESFARRVLDDSGRVLSEQIILRLKESGPPFQDEDHLSDGEDTVASVSEVELREQTGTEEELHTDEELQAVTDDIDEEDWEGDFVEAAKRRRCAGCSTYTADDAAWAPDNINPATWHLTTPGISQAFDFNASHLANLCDLNSFHTSEEQDEVLFGLRGCMIVDTENEGRFVSSIRLSEDEPDHFDYHCVLGVWKRSTSQIAVFRGSTVPNWFYMCKQAEKKGRKANLLSTGLYIYKVNAHRKKPGMFRLLQKDVVVLRSNDNLIYETTDKWDRCYPADNIHPGYSPACAHFSSAGCQTIPGNFRNNRHAGNWGQFRQRAGLDPNNNKDKWNTRYIYVLLTGREARLISTLPTSQHESLRRLRFGSKGAFVSALQRALGISDNGKMDAGTTMSYIKWQQRIFGGRADAIVTPFAASQLGFRLSDLISGPVPGPAPAPAPAPAPPAGPVPGANWSQVPSDQRMRYVMERLVVTYHYPVNGAAGIVGNLLAESEVIPNRIEGSHSNTPMRARDFNHVLRNFTPNAVMNRDYRTAQGPRLPGVGLAQWTTANRRRGLFQHTYNGQQLGANILFNMDAQVDYLVSELQRSYPRLDRTLRNPNVTVDDAADEMVYDFERPGAILTTTRPRQRLPRGDANVQAVFRRRRRNAQRALAAYQNP